ncbi:MULTISPECIES: Phr family secreted Rap phosphatase inhibitor [Bacillus cereus group]|nr:MULTISPECIES: Phr family secreted Rap phosphatase inhibitor [Bacillus cereus group]MCP1397044.1 Phr family secreted Rap phosphatase inhibitor [Bacillus cereus]MED3682276.1 Phr family secreted Rap phosphatase inhibitor [Bacillus thuringiensis]OBW90484.1 aspartate phosphatase [Bacillus cereus]PER57322.1 Phr family secreted Rap phosphatase inhibitor [Bacillus thuringiensis]PES52889.1 Phr family secreted Rap phosphatase inhibitor [Bacillus thuringiensis]
MKKLGVIVTGLITTTVLAFGLNSLGDQSQALNRGDGGAPARPDYVNIGDTGGAPANNKGDGGAPANFNKGDGGGVS